MQRGKETGEAAPQRREDHGQPRAWARSLDSLYYQTLDVDNRPEEGSDRVDLEHVTLPTVRQTSVRPARSRQRVLVVDELGRRREYFDSEYES